MKRYLFLVLFVILFSCENNIDLKEVKPPAKNEIFRSKEDAKLLATNFLLNSFQEKGNIETRSLSLEIKDVDVLDPISTKGDSYVKNKVYSVNFKNKKSVLVPANKKFPKVIAFFENKNFYFDDLNKEAAAGTAFLLYNIITQLSKEGNTRSLFNKEVEMMPDEDKHSVAGDNSNQQGLYKVKPRVKVFWDQTDPFNTHTPTVLNFFTKKTKKGFVGCVPLAIGQAMTVLQSTNTFEGINLNWNNLIKVKDRSFKETYPSELETVAKFLSKIGVYIGAEYKWKSTSANTKKSIKKIHEKLGFNYERHPSFSSSGYHIRKHLYDDDKSVVIMSGRNDYKDYFVFGYYASGHVFIIDGFKVVRDLTRDTDISRINPYPFVNTGGIDAILYPDNHKEVFYHVNFGWGPSSNGYFLGSLLDTYFTPETYPYNYQHETETVLLFTSTAVERFPGENCFISFQKKLNKYVLT